MELNKLIFNHSIDSIIINPNISYINNYIHEKIYKSDAKAIIKNKKKHCEFIKKTCTHIPQNIKHII